MPSNEEIREAVAEIHGEIVKQRASMQPIKIDDLMLKVSNALYAVVDKLDEINPDVN